ncbi:MAG: hypothetical protein WC047_01250 [Kiritimatiellales bacterium]
MTGRMVVLFVIALLAGSAQAMLPPDAKAREPQLRVYRQKLTDNYEKRMVERQAEAVRAYEQTRLNVSIPPWLRDGKTAVQAGLDSADAGKNKNAAKRNHRLLISIVLLILISSVVGWVRYATRKLDE